MINFGQQALAGFAYVVGLGAQFEKEMSFIGAITKGTAEDIDQLRQYTIKLGKEGPFGPIELSKAFVELVKAGISTEEIMGGVGTAMTNLAQAADISAAEAGEALVKTMAQFDLAAKDAERIASVVSGAANASIIDVSDMFTTLNYVGPIAHSMGIELEDLATTIAVLGQSGIQGSQAGTSLRMALTRLLNPTKAGETALKRLGIVTEDGTNKLLDQNGRIKDLTTVWGIFNEHVDGLSDTAKQSAFFDIFGQRSMTAMNYLIEQSTDTFEEFNKEIKGADAADIASKRMDNLDGAVRKFKATLEAVLMGPSGEFQGMLQGIVEAATKLLKWFDALPSGLKTFLLGAVGVIGVLSLMGGAFLLTIGTIVRAVRVAGELYHAFRVIGPMFRTAAAGARVFSAALLTNPVFLIIAALVLLGVALYHLYHRWEAFHDFVDGAWQSFQRGWDRVTDAVVNLWHILQNTDWVQLGKDIVQGLIDGLSSIPIVGPFVDLARAAWDAFAGFFGISSPSKLMFGAGEDILRGLIKGLSQDIGNLIATAAGLATKLFGALTGWISQLPGMVGYFLGLTLGSIARFSAQAVQMAWQFGTDFVTTIFDWVTQLPSMIWPIFLSIVDMMWQFTTQMVSAAFELGSTLFLTLFSFISQLPSMVWTFFTGMLNTIWQALPGIAGAAQQTGSSILSGVIDFVTQLPGRVWDLMQQVASTIRSFASVAWNAAWEVGQGIWNGLWDAISGLPSMVGGIFSSIMSTVRSWGSSIWGAVEDFGGGLVRGFMNGIDAHSPSAIERAMFAIQDEADRTALLLRRSVRQMGLAGAPVMSYGSASGTSSSSGVGSLVIQGPLLQVDTLTGTEEEAISISRRLSELTYKQLEAQGRRQLKVLGPGGS